jgi:hypothetical protein
MGSTCFGDIYRCRSPGDIWLLNLHQSGCRYQEAPRVEWGSRLCHRNSSRDSTFQSDLSCLSLHNTCLGYNQSNRISIAPQCCYYMFLQDSKSGVKTQSGNRIQKDRHLRPQTGVLLNRCHVELECYFQISSRTQDGTVHLEKLIHSRHNNTQHHKYGSPLHDGGQSSSHTIQDYMLLDQTAQSRTKNPRDTREARRNLEDNILRQHRESNQRQKHHRTLADRI